MKTVHCVGRSRANPLIGFWHVENRNAILMRAGKQIPHHERLQPGDVFIQQDSEYAYICDESRQIGSLKWHHVVYVGPDWECKVTDISEDAAKTIYQMVGVEFPTDDSW